MKRAAVVICAFVLAMMGLTTASTASVVSVTATNCDHYSGGGIFPRSAGYVFNKKTGSKIGAVQVCKDSESRYWGYVVFYNPLVAQTWAEVSLYRIYNGDTREFNCESEGGNDHVAPGQTRCWTPKLRHPSPSVTFYAVAEACTGYYPNCDNPYAFGDTWPPVH